MHGAVANASTTVGGAGMIWGLEAHRRQLEQRARQNDPSVLIVFSHVHKAMGCSVCDMARENYGAVAVPNMDTVTRTTCLFPGPVPAAYLATPAL